MKKIILIMVLALVTVTSAFAYDPNNNGWWIGPTASYMNQGVEATYDFGRFDVEGTFGVPVVLGAVAMFDSPRAFLEMLLVDQLTVTGYYSVVDADWFTFNVGIQGMAFNCTTYYDGDTAKGYPAGWGGAVILGLTPAVEMKFQLNNKVSIKVRMNTTTIQIGDHALGLGTYFAYGNNNAALSGAIIAGLFTLYNFASVGCEFKI